MPSPKKTRSKKARRKTTLARRPESKTRQARPSKVAPGDRLHTVRAPRRPTKRGLLVINCDPVKLAMDGFTVGAETVALVRASLPKLDVRELDACNDAELLEGCARLSTEGFKASVALIIGHASCDLLQLTATRRVEWASVAEWLRPFDPADVVIFGCEGGRTLPGMALASGLPKLRAVHGTPLKHTNAEMRILAFQVLLLLAKVKLPPDVELALKGANLLMNGAGGLLLTRKRSELLSGDFSTSTKHIAEEALKALLGR